MVIDEERLMMMKKKEKKTRHFQSNIYLFIFQIQQGNTE